LSKLNVNYWNKENVVSASMPCIRNLFQMEQLVHTSELVLVKIPASKMTDIVSGGA